MSRLLADENFPLPVIEELRRLGHDVLTVQEAGRANQQFPDNEVLSLASAGESLSLIDTGRKGGQIKFKRYGGVIGIQKALLLLTSPFSGQD